MLVNLRIAASPSEAADTPTIRRQSAVATVAMRTSTPPPRKRLVVVAVTRCDGLMHIKTEIRVKSDTAPLLSVPRDLSLIVPFNDADAGLRLQEAHERCGVSRGKRGADGKAVQRRVANHEPVSVVAVELLDDVGEGRCVEYEAPLRPGGRRRKVHAGRARCGRRRDGDLLAGGHEDFAPCRGLRGACRSALGRRMRHRHSAFEYGHGRAGLLSVDVELRTDGADSCSVTFDDERPRESLCYTEERLTLKQFNGALMGCETHANAGACVELDQRPIRERDG